MTHVSTGAIKLTVALTCIVVASACGSDPKAGTPCDANSECGNNHACVSGQCLQQCGDTSQCPDKSFVCGVSGLCEPVPNAECTSDASCDGPNSCQEGVGARCIGGFCDYVRLAAGTTCDDGDVCTTNDTCNRGAECVGEAVVCNAPPDNQCNSADDSFLSYPSSGTCNASTGDCEYVPTQTACSDCIATCLASCAGVTCDELNGGCRSAGRCVPGPTATCSYDEAPGRSLCNLPSSTQGAKDGVCSFGDCVECTQAADCDPTPGVPPTCNTPTAETDCQGARIDVICDANICGTQTVDDDRGCGGVSRVCPGNLLPIACADTAIQDAPICPAMCTAGGCVADFECNPSNGQCESTLAQTGEACSSAGECVAQHSCVGPSGSMICLKNNGQTCSDNDECENTCIQTLCAPMSGTLNPCDESNDCTSGHECFDSNTCLLNDGQQGCTNNNQCTNVCRVDTCGPPADFSGSCDETTDCGPNLLCDTVNNVCVREDGDTCGTDSDCFNVCRIDECGPRGGINDSCDASSDCSQSLECSDGQCKRSNGQPCGSNQECAGICRVDHCADVGGEAALCDEDDDCGSGVTCDESAGRCRLEDGQSCSGSTQCLNTCECADAQCSANICSAAACDQCAFTSTGESCDGTLDSSVSCDDGFSCSTGDVCTGGFCLPTSTTLCGSCECNCLASVCINGAPGQPTVASQSCDMGTFALCNGICTGIPPSTCVDSGGITCGCQPI